MRHKTILEMPRGRKKEDRTGPVGESPGEDRAAVVVVRLAAPAEGREAVPRRDGGAGTGPAERPKTGAPGSGRSVRMPIESSAGRRRANPTHNRQALTEVKT
jgi:hypothetical protein